MENPIELVDRRKTQEYASARPLSKEAITNALGRMDQSTLAGKRDYALLLLFLSTGRRASEVLALEFRHLHFGEGLTIHFERCKGNKSMYDTAEQRVERAILHYLHTVFGPDLG